LILWYRSNKTNSPKLFFRVVLSDDTGQLRVGLALSGSSVDTSQELAPIGG
jgi:hypothetical protein